MRYGGTLQFLDLSIRMNHLEDGAAQRSEESSYNHGRSATGTQSFKPESLV